MNEMLNF